MACQDTTDTTDAADFGVDQPAAGQDGDGGSSLEQRGQVVAAGEGFSITTDVSVGQPVEGAGGAPGDVISACRWGSPSTLASAVFIAAHVDVSYEGSVPERVGFPSSVPMADLDEQIPLSGYAVQSDDGSITCDQPVFVSDVAPGSTIKYDVWELIPLITNAHPAATPEDLDHLVFTGIGYSSGNLFGGGTGGVVGDHVLCDKIMVFGDAPSDYPC